MNTANRQIQTDQISLVDELDRKKYAKEISENILHHIETNHDSLVVGIHGAWGDGKSNLLHFIKENIKQHSFYTISRTIQKQKFYQFKKKETNKVKKLFLLEFNPWMFSGKEQLHRAFLHEFALKVKNEKHELRTKVESFAHKIHWLGEVGESFQKGATALFDIPIEELKNETNEMLINEEIYLVIVIDDIDRLAPQEMLEVFQLIKLNANFKNTVFLVSFDKKIVTESIWSSYQINGAEYLEKIIQVDYNLPAIPSEVLEAMFFNRLSKLLGEQSSFDISSLNSVWLIHGLKFYFNNIRDLNRYFNSVSFRLPSIISNINLHDFLIIEAVRLFDFDVYEVIRNNYQDSLRFDANSHFHAALAGIPVGPTKQIFLYLFKPSWQNAKLKDTNFRIREGEYFERYFTLSPSNRNVREEEFENFRNYPASRLNLLKSLIQNSKVEFLLRRIAVKPSDFSGNHIANALSSLMDVWQEYKEHFVDHWKSTWAAIKALIKAEPDPNDSMQKFLNDLCHSSSEFRPAHFVFLWLVLENLSKKDDKNIDPDLSEYEQVLKANQSKLESHFKMQVENQAPFLFLNPSYNALYQRIFMRSYASLLPDKYIQQLQQVIQDDQRVFLILDIIVVRDIETQKPVGINNELAQLLIPVRVETLFMNKLKTMNAEALSNRNAASLKYFSTHYKSNIKISV